ncbi:MAG: hypothetical protein KIS85_03600 [Anaerolineales bacterium]|nr:hypothetical protein [Anaerolineales bacterium]
MISSQLLYAIFQGFPSQHLRHLPNPWPRLAGFLSFQSVVASDPEQALRAVFAKLPSDELQTLRTHFHIAYHVSQIPGLSPRQREALWTLRAHGVLSLTRLAQLLARDRGNLHHTLSELIAKGLVIKLLLPRGQHYFSVEAPLSPQDCHAIDMFLEELMHQAEHGTGTQHLEHSPELSSSTNATKSARPTNFQPAQTRAVCF